MTNGSESCDFYVESIVIIGSLARGLCQEYYILGLK